VTVAAALMGAAATDENLPGPLLHLIVLLEERELPDRFGEAYVDYSRRVPRYWPRRA
jgi:protein-S-isoprenylcysteine O-methyltransferase Ste14